MAESEELERSLEKAAACAAANEEGGASGDAAPDASGQHPLETPWTFWFDKKQTKQSTVGNYQENLRRIGTFKTVEEFWQMYAYLLRPSELPKDSNYHVFRNELIPMWESFPTGGCWILKIKKDGSKKNPRLGSMWEELLFATIGEAFEEPDVVGIVLSIRNKEDLLSIWNRDNDANSTVRFKIGDRLREVLNLDEKDVVEYKDNSSSMKDRSTFRNAKPYIFAATHASPVPEDGEEAPSEGAAPAQS